MQGCTGRSCAGWRTGAAAKKTAEASKPCLPVGREAAQVAQGQVADQRAALRFSHPNARQPLAVHRAKGCEGVRGGVAMECVELGSVGMGGRPHGCSHATAYAASKAGCSRQPAFLLPPKMRTHRLRMHETSICWHGRAGCDHQATHQATASMDMPRQHDRCRPLMCLLLTC